MASFSNALKYVFKNEGGYSDNPDDSGGKTNFGITESSYSFYLQRKATDYDMRALTQDIAAKVYKSCFWDPYRLDDVVSDAVATAIFDQIVNRGPIVIKEVQRLVMANQDGLMGPKTLELLNAEEPKEFINNLSKSAIYEYKSIVLAHPEKKEFINGWINRANKLTELT